MLQRLTECVYQRKAKTAEHLNLYKVYSTSVVYFHKHLIELCTFPGDCFGPKASYEGVLIFGLKTEKLMSLSIPQY